jgi:hypothetical protein
MKPTDTTTMVGSSGAQRREGSSRVGARIARTTKADVVASCRKPVALAALVSREILVESLEVTVRQGHRRQQRSGLSLLARPRFSL